MLQRSALPFQLCVQLSEVSSVLEEGLLEVFLMNAVGKNIKVNVYKHTFIS